MPDPGASSDSKRRVVLLIHDDPQVARMTRAALGQRWEVLSSGRPDAGLRLATGQKPDVVVVGTMVSGTDGLALTSRLLGETRQAAVILFGQESRVSRVIGAMQLGAADFVTERIDGTILRQRIEAAVSAVAGGATQPEIGPAAAHLRRLVERIEMERASGTLRLRRVGAEAEIVFRQGRISSAICGPLRGMAVAAAVGRQSDWQVQFDSAPLPEIASLASLASSAGRARPPGTGPNDPTQREVHGRSLEPEAAFDEAPIEEADSEERTVLDPFDPFGGAAQRKEDEPRWPATVPEVVVTPEAVDPEHLVMVGTPATVRPDRTSETVPSVVPRVVGQAEQPPARPEQQVAEDSLVPLDSVVEFVEDDPTLDSPVPMAGPGTHEEVLLELATGDVVEVANSDHQEAEHARVSQWVVAMGSPPLLLVGQRAIVNQRLEKAARKRGFIVSVIEEGSGAYNAARKKQPVALLADAVLPDVEGRDLLAAVRADFMLREVPYVMFSGAELEAQLRGGLGETTESIMRGLDAALRPRAELYEKLCAATEEVGGWVEPAGLTSLLRILGGLELSGHLHLRVGTLRTAELLLYKGQICGVSTTVGQRATGPLAMVDLVGCEWQEYAVEPDPTIAAQPPMGELGALVGDAARHNNALLRRVFAHGLKQEGVALDEHALEAYWRTLPSSLFNPIVQLTAGDAPAKMVSTGIVQPSVIQALLIDMRRKGVIRLLQLPPVIEEEKDWAVVRPRGGSDKEPESAGRPRGHWLVVLLTSLITVLLAAGGYAAFRTLSGDRPAVRPLTSVVSDAAGEQPDAAQGSSMDAGSRAATGDGDSVRLRMDGDSVRLRMDGDSAD